MTTEVTRPWGKDHRIEAESREHEMSAAKLRRTGFALDLRSHPDEGLFRWWLRYVAKCSPKRIDREVQRVRDIAEGRLAWKHEIRWAVDWPEGRVEYDVRDGADEGRARTAAKQDGGRLVRIVKRRLVKV